MIVRKLGFNFWVRDFDRSLSYDNDEDVVVVLLYSDDGYDKSKIIGPFLTTYNGEHFIVFWIRHSGKPYHINI